MCCHDAQPRIAVIRPVLVIVLVMRCGGFSKADHPMIPAPDFLPDPEPGCK
jgi:hypothetical protein